MQMRHKCFAISVLVTIVALLAIGGGILIFGSRTAPATPEPTPGASSEPSDADAEPVPTEASAPVVRFEGRYVDVHAHIGPKNMPLEEIVRNMDLEGIDTMVVMMTPTAIAQGMPTSDSGIPNAAEQYPGRFISLYGGEAITLLDAVVARGSFTKAEQKQYVALLEEAMASDKYSGFGEIALRHVLPKPGEGADVTVPGDHPWMLIMSDIAAKYDVPIDVHMDIEAGANGIAGLETLLDHNKKTTIVWSHTAWSRTDYESFPIVELRRLLETHPNLYSSIKIQTETAFMDPNKKIKPEWLALFEDYSGRFLVGSDIKPGLAEDEFRFVERHRKFLEQLPPEIVKAFERDNAIEVFKIG